MVDRRKVNSADEVPKESDRQFLERAGVGTLMKDALGKIIANRPEDPITFLADYFDSLDDSTSLVHRAEQILKMTHHSRPLFEPNVRMAYNILSKHKVGKKVFGVNGTVYSDLLVVLCRNMPEAVMNRLLLKIECAPHEAVPFEIFKSGVFTCCVLQDRGDSKEPPRGDSIEHPPHEAVPFEIFKSGVFTCCVLQDFVRLAEQLFYSLDIQRTGKANKALCDVVIEQLHTALGSNRKDARRILESGYNLGVDGLYLALERAISRSQRNASLQTCDQFIVEVSDAFLSKVKKQS